MYTGMVNEISSLMSDSNRGVRVYIGNRTTIPMLTNNRFDVQTEISTSVRVKRSFYNQLPKPFSECT